jgi:hypothetical protein
MTPLNDGLVNSCFGGRGGGWFAWGGRGGGSANLLGAADIVVGGRHGCNSSVVGVVWVLIFVIMMVVLVRVVSVGYGSLNASLLGRLWLPYTLLFPWFLDSLWFGSPRLHCRIYSKTFFVVGGPLLRPMPLVAPPVRPCCGG